MSNLVEIAKQLRNEHVRQLPKKDWLALGVITVSIIAFLAMQGDLKPPSNSLIKPEDFDKQISTLQANLPDGFSAANNITKTINLGHLDGTSELTDFGFKPEIIKIKDNNGQENPVVGYPVKDKGGGFFLYINGNRLIPLVSFTDGPNKSKAGWNTAQIQTIP